MRLRYFLSFVFFLVTFTNVFSQKSIREKIIGTWEATDNADEFGSLKFLDSLNVIITIEGEALPKGIYIIDTTKKPMWLDIIIKNGDKTATIKSLFQLIDDDTIKWQIFFDGNRTNDFSKETDEDTIILKRKKD